MKKRALFNSIIALILCVAMLAGSTFAWFTDSSVSTGNIIQSGNLDIEMYWAEDLGGSWNNVEDSAKNKIFDYEYWEPGYTQVRYIRIVNAGSLAFRYALEITPNGEVTDLAKVIDVYAVIEPTAELTGRDSLGTPVGTLADVISGKTTANGVLHPLGASIDAGEYAGEIVLGIALKMQEDAGNEYQNKSIGDSFDVTLLATQYTYEEDSFGDDYDADAEMPGLKGDASGSTTVKTENGVTTSDTTITTNTDVKATVPAGVAVEGDKLTLSVSAKESTDSNVTAGDGEDMVSLDVHVEGVSADNTTPIIVELGAILGKALNQGNMALYHVENGTTNAMTQVLSLADLDAHNEYYYDPATGNVTVALATFSEVALVAEQPKWEGNRDYSWYTNAVAPVSEGEPDYVIANADQLAALSAIVGGMDGQTQDSFAGKTVKLISDINLGDKESENNPDIIFYPIGYNSDDGKYEKTGVAVSTGFYSFEGTFDGNGHTIANFYHNTWEMKGDHNWYSPEEQYYRDGMGLFGRVYKGTVKNLTVKNFSSDGEIATTGVIAAYADGATFENIAIFDCNPRVYNIGNGGIVGCVGWYAKEADLKTTFTNITVDNSNKISALWGSYDVACGGIVGQYYPTSGQTSAGTPKNGGVHFENCHVSAQMDVYNDVCANYQYYAYRYTGMLIGSVRENETIDGHVYPKMDGITASGCTVHFGTWNDYYYCEIIDNTTASYTHDYQMSRLVEIKAIDGTTITYLDGTTGTVPASGRANYVIVDYTKGHGTENATCYHFKDGAVWTHDMGGIQTGIDENGDGQDDLKEDKQHIYLEFNNLVTGYGWGVTSKGVGDMEGVTILDREEGNTYPKFEKADTAKDSYTTESTVTIGNLFKAASIEDSKLTIKGENVQVFVSPADNTSTANGTYVANTTDWTQGTLTFSGTGAATITITDYYFCEPTTINVTITEKVAAEKFEVVMNNGDFLHRVGNSGTVALDKLFAAKEGATIGTVSVTIEAVEGTSASGTYTSNATWTNGTIQFSGTGVVKVTITDNDYCTPTELYLEVVDAVNATTATSATANNVVLLNDCGFSSLEVSNGYALYGNGFTMTCGSDSASLSFGQFVTLNNGTLDNVQIVCPNYDYAALYNSQLTGSDNRAQTTDKTRYYNAKSAVLATGNSQILNSRISGGRAALYASNGNIVVDNSRLELGAVATVMISAANSFVFRDVTLVQKPTASTYDSSKTLMGMSVLYMCDADGNATPTTIEGGFVQYAWADSSCTAYMPEGTSSIASTVLNKNNYTHTIDGKSSVNLGFAYMSEGKSIAKPSNITDNRSNKTSEPYGYEEVKATVPVNGVNVTITTFVYSYQNTQGTAEAFKSVSAYTPNKYSDIVAVTYSDTTDGLTSSKSYGTNGWVYELTVDLDKVSDYKLDFSKLSMSINGVSVTDFKVNDGAKPTALISVTAGGTSYTLAVTVDGKAYVATFVVTGVETGKDAPSLIKEIGGNKITADDVDWGASKCVVRKADDGNTNYTVTAPVLQGLIVRYWSVAQGKYVDLDLTTLTPAASTALNGTNNYWEYTDPNGDFTLKVTNTAYVHDSNKIYAMPVSYNGTLYFVATSADGLVSTGSGARQLKMKYEFRDNNNGELIFEHGWSQAYDKNNTLNYKDLTGIKDGCVTPDTLITLADGTQVRVDSLKGDELLLVWNMETGKLDSAPIMFVDSETEAEFEIVHLYFSDGTDVKVIYEHGFWDYDLNKYVYLDRYAENYIGHTFAKQNGESLEKVKLVDVVIETEVTTAWSPVTEGHLCYFVNGMLSMPGGVGGLFNIFDVDPNTMTYDYEAMARDIETYGLFTYEELNAIVPLSREMFEAAGGAYLKVSIGKGNLTMDELIAMIQRYSVYFD